ncbi:MAG: hypothetical protein JXB46_03255, partial [Candidatus Eisenbacteria bacterium]|nr:hypothetical protein [Candidatus Eisenbacteria bacterium]
MKSKRPISLFMIGVSCVLLLSCGRLNRWGRLKQIDSFTRVAAIAKKLDNRRVESDRPLADSEIDRIIMSVGSGLDGWGHKIHILKTADDHSERYVVMSPGRDGKLDFPDTEQYFTLPRVDIRGLFNRDILFRDGRCVTNAGK